MNVSLTPELEKFVHQKAQSGMYHSASEVIRAALRQFIESERVRTHRLQQLNREIDHGLRDIAEGKVMAGENVFAEINEMGAKRRKKPRV
jgi:antitoxin ParD1/3/4